MFTFEQLYNIYVMLFYSICIGGCLGAFCMLLIKKTKFFGDVWDDLRGSLFAKITLLFYLGVFVFIIGGAIGFATGYF
jgi:hypothetical protein